MSETVKEAAEGIVKMVADVAMPLAVRRTLDAVAEAFEEMARDDVDGESGTITYRQVITALRNTGPQPPEPQSVKA